MRKLLIGVALVVTALVVVGIVAVTQIDPKHYVEIATAKVKEATGRELKIEGKVGFSVSLLPTVAIEGVRLQNAPWGSRPDMIMAKRIEVQIALLPLLSGNVEVRGLTLIEPDVLLEVDAKGAKNWEFHPPGAEAKPAPAQADTQSLPPIAIRRASIEKATLAYRDAKEKQTKRIELVQLALSGSGGKLELKTSGKLNDAPFEVKAEMDHGGRLGTRGAVGKGAMQLSSPGLKLTSEGQFPVSAGGLEGLDVRFTAEVTDWIALGKLAASEFPKLPALKAEGTARAKNETLAIDELKASIGKSSATGSLRIGLDPERRDLQARLDAPFVDLAELLGPDQPEKPSPDGRIFSAEPFALDGLKTLAGQFDLRIAKLALRDGKTLDGVQATTRFDNGKITANPIVVNVEGRPLRVSANADATSGKSMALNLTVDGQGISLGALGALLNISGTPEGSPTDIAVRFNGAGASVRALMASANADVRIVVGPGRIKNRAIDLGADVTELLNAINPARASDPYTELKCAVIRLPIRQGVARVENSIAAETAKVNVIAAGVIDLRSETLDLGIRPKAATGLGIGLGGLANLGRLRGSFAHPKVELDFSGTAQAATQLGLAAATGGLSLLAGGLLTDSVPDQPCQAALTGVTRAAPSVVDKAKSLGSGVVDGIKKFFSR